MAKVSLIIPTFNRPQLLPRCVESALRAGRDVEVVVVDDASADRTASVCEGLRGIRYVRLERNQGVAGARNVGLLASTCDYVAFLDDDDLRLPGSLASLAAVLPERPAGFAPAAATGYLLGIGLKVRAQEILELLPCRCRVWSLPRSVSRRRSAIR